MSDGTTKLSQTIIFNGKCEHAHRLGTEFFVYESIFHSVKEFTNVNPRISTLTLRTEKFDMVLINVHVYIEVKDDKEKSFFPRFLKAC